MMSIQASELHNVKTTHRLSRVFKRLSLMKVSSVRSSYSRDSPIHFNGSENVEDTVQDVGTTGDHHFSYAFPRASSRFSDYSARTSKQSERVSQILARRDTFTDSKVEVKLDCINEDGIYRPGDSVQGQIKLDSTDKHGRALRSVTVRIEGKAKM